MALDPDLQDGLDGEPILFHALEMTLNGESPPAVIRLLDGSMADVSWDGMTFVSEDPVYGTLVLPEAWEEGLGDEVPHLTFGLLPPTSEARAAVAQPDNQNGLVRFFFGVIDPETGQPQGDPKLEFTAALDVATLHADRDMAGVECDATSAIDAFLENNEGVTYSDASHQAHRPGEKFFQYTSQSDRQLPWGSKVEGPRVSSPSQFGSLGGGGWFGVASQGLL